MFRTWTLVFDLLLFRWGLQAVGARQRPTSAVGKKRLVRAKRHDQ
jgi:hypothetical protein